MKPSDMMVMEPFGRIPRWAACPPKGAYLGWFTNEFGGRWVFVAHGDTMRLAGDMEDWKVHELKPTPDDILRFEARDDFQWPEDVALNVDERLWLASCLSAAAAIARGRLEAQVEEA